jgi:hypothetical protein
VGIEEKFKKLKKRNWVGGGGWRENKFQKQLKPGGKKIGKGAKRK